LSLDGFTVHAARRAGAFHLASREALLGYVCVLRSRRGGVELRRHGLVRVTPRKAYADGTIAVDTDPLSPLCRLATSAAITASVPLSAVRAAPEKQSIPKIRVARRVPQAHAFVGGRPAAP
jgi:hypothetical protein